MNNIERGLVLPVKHEISLSDHRKIAVLERGDPYGEHVIFGIHGTPSSRLMPLDKSVDLTNTRFVTFDKPGCGGTTRHKGYKVSDIAEYVKSIADNLHIENFSVFGVSGGGPYALACAALLSDRVSSAVTIASFAPPEFPEWFVGMGKDNTDRFREATDNPEALWQELTKRALAIKKDPEGFLRELATKFNEELSKDKVSKERAQSCLEAVKRGAVGWFDDNMAIRKRWGLDLSSITIPLKIIHGKYDTIVPVGHAHFIGEQAGVEPDIIDTKHLSIQWGQAFDWIRNNNA